MGFVLGARGAFRGLYGGGALRGGRVGVVIREQEGSEPAAHMPLHMISKHAQEHVGSHAMAESVVDGTHVQVDGLEAAEGAFDRGQPLVGVDRLRDDVPARFVLPFSEGERVIPDEGRTR